jgi:hypothetical protein
MGYQQQPFTLVGAGIRTELATVLPPGSRVVAYVDSNGAGSYTDPAIKPMIRTTLNSALGLCRSGDGDVVVVMPNHSENISSADQMSSLVAGTKIIGLGFGNKRGTFYWTAAAATFLLDVADVSLINLRLFMAGSRTSTTALTTAAPITVSAAGCGIFGCEIDFGVDANQLVTVGITTTAAGDQFFFHDNYCVSDTAAECTTFLRLVGADHASIEGNTIIGATSSVEIGLVQFITTDSLNVRMGTERANHLRNNKALSQAVVVVSAGATSSSGTVNNLYLTALSDGANALVLGHADGAWNASVAAFTFGRHVYAANLAGERMAEVTVVSA